MLITPDHAGFLPLGDASLLHSPGVSTGLSVGLRAVIASVQYLPCVAHV